MYPTSYILTESENDASLGGYYNKCLHGFKMSIICLLM